jgi:hypothetical protein
MVCIAFAVIVMDAIARMAVYINVRLWLANGIPCRIAFSFPETGTAGILCIFCPLALYHNIAFAAVLVFIVIAIHCRTL